MATRTVKQGLLQRCCLLCLMFVMQRGIYSQIVTDEADNPILRGNLIESVAEKNGLAGEKTDDSQGIFDSKSQLPFISGGHYQRLLFKSEESKEPPADMKVNAQSSGINTEQGDPHKDKTLIFSRGCEGGDCPPITSSRRDSVSEGVRGDSVPEGSPANTPQTQTGFKELANFSAAQPPRRSAANWRVIDALSSGGVRWASPRGEAAPFPGGGDKQAGGGASPDRDTDLNRFHSRSPPELSETGSIRGKHSENSITRPRSETNARVLSDSSDLRKAGKPADNLLEIGNEVADSRGNDTLGNGDTIHVPSPRHSFVGSILHADGNISNRPNGVIHSHLGRNNKQNVIIQAAFTSADIGSPSAGTASPTAIEQASSAYKAGTYFKKLLFRGRTIAQSRARPLDTQITRNESTKADSKSRRLQLEQIGYSKVNRHSIEERLTSRQFTQAVQLNYLRKPNNRVGTTGLFRRKRDATPDSRTDINAEINPENVSSANESLAGEDEHEEPQSQNNNSAPSISLRSEGLLGLVDPSRERARYGAGAEQAGGGMRGHPQPEPGGPAEPLETSVNTSLLNASTDDGVSELDTTQVGSGSEDEQVVPGETTLEGQAGTPESLPEYPNTHNQTVDDMGIEPWQSPENATVDGRWLEDNSTVHGNGSATEFEVPPPIDGDMKANVWPQPEPKPEPQPEAEVTPTSEGNTGCDGPSCYVEPVPDWDAAKRQWQAGWEIHVYGAGILFAVIAVYSLISIIGLVSRRDLMSQGYFITLNIMLLIMCATRAVYLLVDGYNSRGTFHPILAYFLFNIAFPCITSAFSILFLALLQTLKMQLLSPKIQRPGVLFGIIMFHFTLAVVTDVVIGSIADYIIMLVVCEIFFVLWGAVMFTAYIYIFRKLYVAARRRHKEMLRLAISQTKLAGAEEQAATMKAPRPVFNAAVKITLVTAILGLVSAGLEVYAIIGIFRSVRGGVAEPWPWWGVHFASRLTEVGMCITMSYVATQPFRYNRLNSSSAAAAGKERTSCLDIIYFVPCHRYCSDPVKEQYVSAPTECSYSQQQPITYNPAYGYVNEYIYNTAAAAANGVQVPEEDEPVSPTVPNGSLKSKSLDSRGRDKKRKSMLVNDDGFVRFREDGDPEGEFIVSTDDELNSNDGVFSNGRARVISGPNGCPNTLTYYLANGPSSPRRFHSISVPNTGENTPATPRSFCSTDFELDMAGSVFSFRPPSSIHLRESIEGALNYYPRFTLKTPDYAIDTPDSLSRPRTPDELDADDYHSAKSGPPDTPGETRQADLSPSVHGGGNRFSTRSMGDVKTTWFHKSPKNYWRAISQARAARSSNLSLASRTSSRYSPLDDSAALSSRHKTGGLCRSRSDSLAGNRKTDDSVNVRESV